MNGWPQPAGAPDGWGQSVVVFTRSRALEPVREARPQAGAVDFPYAHILAL